MRAIVGFLALHAVLIATGFTVLRALGLMPLSWERRIVGSAMGPALLTGATLVLPLLVVLLVVGVPLTLVSAGVACLGCAGAAELAARRRTGANETVDASGAVRRQASSAGVWSGRLGLAAAGAYLAGGAFALGRLPTVLDDARIWSLRGVTLAYYHGLQPETFQNPGQSGGHPIYPLFQPALEALVSQAMGRPQLRFFHVELWLLFAAAIWTAVYLVARHCPRRLGRSTPIWIAPLALVALTPAAILNIVMGYADATGSVILATGALALGLWLAQGDSGLLALAAVLLAAAANTKDEDLVAAGLVLVVGLIASITARPAALGAHGRQRLRLFGAALFYFAVLVAPWRIWTAAHHLSDAVTPPLPRALSPAYIFSRTHELHETVTAMLTQTLNRWGWLAAIFITACIVCIITQTARRVAWFYRIFVRRDCHFIALAIHNYPGQPRLSAPNEHGTNRRIVHAAGRLRDRPPALPAAD